MKFLIYALLLIALVIASGFLYTLLSGLKNQKWYNKPPAEGNYIDFKGLKLYYREKGKNGATVVVINAIGSSQAEWWKIQNDIGLRNRMITWDRTGYNRSCRKDLSGSSKEVHRDSLNQKDTAKATAEELNIILKFKKIRKPVILVANHTGILLALYYAKTFPENVAGMILVNPFPLRYSDFINDIKDIDECPDPLEIIDKNYSKATKGLFRMLSPYKGYRLDRRYLKHIIEHYSKVENYETMKLETSAINDIIDEINNADPFPKIPVRVLYPASEPLIRDFVRSGINEYSSRRLQRVYEQYSSDLINLTPETTSLEVAKAGEYIHISKPDIIVHEINNVIMNNKKKL